MLRVLLRQDKLESLIPELIFGYDRDTLESVAGSWLLARSAMLGVAESCTGGYLAHLMTSVPGSSGTLPAGWLHMTMPSKSTSWALILPSSACMAPLAVKSWKPWRRCS
jgi:hypothetical protein